MKILIVGAGRVGSSVAENLASEQNDITVVDVDASKLTPLQERYDLRVIVGDGTQLSVLRRAGAYDTDLLIACAASDAVNLVVCKVAHHMFNVPRRIARIRSLEYPEQDALLGEAGFCIDAVISPEGTVTQYLLRLIAFPEALQVVEFAGGRVSVLTVRVDRKSPLVNHAPSALATLLPGVNAKVVDVMRQGRSLPVRDGTVLAPGDEALVVVDTRHARQALRELHQAERSVRRVMIAGGGNIGMRLAHELAGHQYSVRIIEYSLDRCEQLASHLPSNALVLHGSATDEALLEREGIDEMDTFLALTSNDEDNIMSSLLAKRLGARKVIALINRQAYGDLMQGSHIDIAVSPSQAAMSELLRHVRRGDVIVAHRLRQGVAEAVEIVAHGDAQTSRVVGKPVGSVRWPRAASVVALVRGEEIILPTRDTIIAADDHVIVFVPSRQQIPEVEKLFQVSAAFF